jgi:hypothetical protein
MGDASRSIGARLYALLLHLYPATFRRDYGESMLQLYNDQCRAARGAGGYAMLWLKTVRDLVRSVPATYFDERRKSAQRGAMSAGALVWIVIAGFVVAFVAFAVVIPSSVGYIPSDEPATVASVDPPTAAELARFRAVGLSTLALVTALLATAALRFSRRQRSVLNGAATFVAGALITFVPLAIMPSLSVRDGRFSLAALSIMSIWLLAAAAWAVSTIASRSKQGLG